MEISEIKKHVTHFSLELASKAKFAEQVVTGGRIISIIPPVDEQHRMSILLLDDQVGTSHVFVSDRLMQHHSDAIQVGKYVFFEGVVSLIYRSEGKATKTEAAVYAYGLKEIPSLEAAY